MREPVPSNESARLAELREIGVLDGAAEADFDALVQLASHICATPIATVSLIDANREWIQAKIDTDIILRARRHRSRRRGGPRCRGRHAFRRQPGEHGSARCAVYAVLRSPWRAGTSPPASGTSGRGLCWRSSRRPRVRPTPERQQRSSGISNSRMSAPVSARNRTGTEPILLRQIRASLIRDGTWSPHGHKRRSRGVTIIGLPARTIGGRVGRFKRLLPDGTTRGRTHFDRVHRRVHHPLVSPAVFSRRRLRTWTGRASAALAS